mgnify:CR=1 FL=1
MIIKYFGELEDTTGVSGEDVELKGKDLEALAKYLVETYQIDLKQYRIAINHNIIAWEDDVKIGPTDEIAILSPFAGG